MNRSSTDGERDRNFESGWGCDDPIAVVFDYSDRADHRTHSLLEPTHQASAKDDAASFNPLPRK